MGDFSHLSKDGQAAMVNVSDKSKSVRAATVKGCVRISAACADKLTDVMAREIITTARIAGIQAAKQTAHLIPLCHPVPLTGADIAIELLRSEQSFHLTVTTHTAAETGVEMEAFAAAGVAGMTIYDMIKAVDPGAEVGPFRLHEKTGGKTGKWTRQHD